MGGDIMTKTLAMMLAAVLAGGAVMGDTVKAALNGLRVEFDRESGALVKMSYPGAGTMLDARPGEATLIDLAYPIDAFQPLRLGARWSRDARITVRNDSVEVRYERLGASRDWYRTDGAVTAVVRFEALPDGRSITVSAEVTNNSKRAVRQVLFPDFGGLVPIGDPAQTVLKTCGFGSAPFVELRPNEGRKSTQFCHDAAAYQSETKSGGRFSGMVARWLDLSSLQGGFSLFPRLWGWDDQVTVRVHHSETEDKLRLLYRNDMDLKPGEIWKSHEFVLTPHTQGWAKGIEPFRGWVREHYDRERVLPLPKHVRDGLGFRTIWMSLGWPDDPQDAVFKAADIPALAKESREYGLDEIVVWGWNLGFTIPIPGPFPHLGTESQFTDAIRESREQHGVNVVPFISVVLAAGETAQRYSLQVSDNGWTQHTETVPRFNPPYSNLYSCAQLGPNNDQWRSEVFDSIKRMNRAGYRSLSWDQFWNLSPEINMTRLAEDICRLNRASDPESTFSGEQLWNIDIDSRYLDYTWNWGGYGDYQAYTHAYPAPRFNICISDSAWSVKRGFMDNLYINVFPRKAGSVNGSDWIRNWPELGNALKQCAALRKQFLPYFTEGKLIGNCILTQWCSSGVVNSYVLSDRALILALNEGQPGKVTFRYDVRPWVTAPGKRYELRRYDTHGILTETAEVSGRGTLSTPVLNSLDFAIYELVAR